MYRGGVQYEGISTGQDNSYGSMRYEELGAVEEGAYLKEAGINSETKTDGVNEKRQHHRQCRSSSCGRKDAI